MADININSEFERYWHTLVSQKKVNSNDLGRIKELLRDSFKEGFLEGMALKEDDIIEMDL